MPGPRYTLAVTGDFQPAFNRALAALQRGRGAEAVQWLTHAMRAPGLRRGDELAVRCALAEAWLLQDDIDQASAVLGRPPDLLRERIEPGRLSALWRLHAQVASARGDQSRAIALFGRALKQAEAAHDSRAIGRVQYELGLCYKRVGEMGIVREHITRASSALHAAGDRRHLALTHSLLGVTLAQSGRFEEAMAALRQAEHLATLIQADDVLAIVCGNQANVASMRHRHDQALALAERSLKLHESAGSLHGLAVALATLGQICVRLGQIQRAEDLLHRALSVRSPVQFHETTGAVNDTLGQIHLIRGNYEAAEAALGQAAEAYGGFGRHASRWYEWGVRGNAARLALRRGDINGAIAQAEDITRMQGVPPADMLQAELIACEALLAAGRASDAADRVARITPRMEPALMPGAWGQFLRVRAQVSVNCGRTTEAYHDFAQSISVFEMLGERHQAGLSHLALARLVARVGARSLASRHASKAVEIFEALGALPDLTEARNVVEPVPLVAAGEYVGSPVDADDVIARRLVDASVLPDLLSLETATALLEAAGGDAAAVFVHLGAENARVLAHVGCDAQAALTLAKSALNGFAYGGGAIVVESLGRDPDGPRLAAVAVARPIGHPEAQRLRLIATIAGQGFQLCGARERRVQPTTLDSERSLEALMPGFICASAAMARVIEQIQRLQGNDLTVLITGESGTGKELVARAIHLGSLRAGGMFLPYNCTTTTRELADSQLFGHRRGSFTGAVNDQPGLIRTAAGGTLFLDEIGDVPLEVQPKLLRFLEEGEIMPVGETRPLRVDVRVIAATNADLEQRVAEGRFREDLYYRLSVIRIHVPPLRERREEIPHLSALFLREACERLVKPGVQLGSETLELFSQHWWPGNVRQLRNEIQRAVAMSPPDSTISPEHLSPDLAAARTSTAATGSGRSHASATLGAAVERLEKDMIRSALERTSGNISETARLLGLTRRGLYLKLKRLGFDTPAGQP
jgi:DNA-binding NtrC family response regulator/tetratricopeptide (TPR) repeat protein